MASKHEEAALSLTYKFGGKKPTGIPKSIFSGSNRSRSESVLLRSLARPSRFFALSGLQRETIPHSALPGTEDCGSRADSPRFLKARRRSLFVRALGFGDSCIFFARLGRQRKREAWKLGLTLQQLKLHPVVLLLIKPDVLSLSSARSGRLSLVCSPLWAPKREEKLWSTT